jgi:flagellar M-ring protein FliF
VLLGLRPAIRAILAAPAAQPAPAAPQLGAETAQPAVASLAPHPDDGDVNLIEDVTKRMNRSPQKRLEQIVEYDEAQAAAILRQWLHQDEAA